MLKTSLGKIVFKHKKYEKNNYTDKKERQLLNTDNKGLQL